MQHDLVPVADARTLASRSARWIAERARRVTSERGHCSFAVSGGTTPWEMFAELVDEDVPWDSLTIYQVDERVAPDGDPDRNLTHLRGSLGTRRVEVVAMPVTADDLDEAASSYAALLPEMIDLVHLGLGPDGHTASLVPGDPVLEVRDSLVGVTQPYQGHRRMTLTYPALARADQLVWLVSGHEKRGPLRQLLAGDTSIPAGRVEARASVVFADEAAR